MQPGRGHRLAIMLPYDNVGLALIPESSGATQVGPSSSPATTPTPTPASRTTTPASSSGPSGRTRTRTASTTRARGGAASRSCPTQGTFYAVTAAGGGYALPIEAPGSYEVAFSGGGIGSHQRSASVGAESALLDLEVPVPEPSQLLLVLVGVAAPPRPAPPLMGSVQGSDRPASEARRPVQRSRRGSSPPTGSRDGPSLLFLPHCVPLF